MNIHISSDNNGTVVTGASFYGGSAVELNHNGTKKFETRSNGVEVSGHITTGC